MNALVGGFFALASGPLGTLDVPPTDLDAAISMPAGRPAVRVLDQDGKQVDMIPASGASGIPLSDYPPVLIDALLVSEDSRFGEHGGIDGPGTIKAGIDTMRGKLRGASGISQQLAKNLITGNERSLARKIEEGALSIRITNRYPRDRILEAYLANVWFGRGVTGAASASRVWFGKGWDEISDAEALTLIVMLRGPARYDPHAHPERVKVMRDNLATRMERAGKLTKKEAEDVRKTPVEAIAPVSTGSTTWVGMAAARDIGPGPAPEGVVTTISSDWQDVAEAAAASALSGIRSAGTEGGLNAAVVVMSVETGEILASVGGIGDAGFDRTFALRQPGSAAKPFFYLSAIDQGVSPFQLVRNDRFSWGSWRPRNANGKETGPAPMYIGLEQSSNLMTLHLTGGASMDVMISVAEASGAWSPGEVFRAPVSMLGASETTLRNLVSGYAGIMAGGRLRTGHSLRSDDVRPNTVFATPEASESVIRMMRGVVTRGTAAGAMKGLKVPIVGKTGTTQDGKDGIFVGATPSVVVGVWVGRDDSRVPDPPMHGNGIPAQIAKEIWTEALAKDLIDERGILEGHDYGGVWPIEPYSAGDADAWTPHIAADDAFDNPDTGGGGGTSTGDPLMDAINSAIAQANSMPAVTTPDTSFEDQFAYDPLADALSEATAQDPFFGYPTGLPGGDVFSNPDVNSDLWR